MAIQPQAGWVPSLRSMPACLISAPACAASSQQAFEQNEYASASLPDGPLRLVAALAGAAMLRRAVGRPGQRTPSRTVVAAVVTEDPATATKKALAQKEAEYRQRREAQRGSSDTSEVPELAELERVNFVGVDGLLQVPAAERGVRASVYAIFSPDGSLEYVGVSRDAQKSLRAHFARRPAQCGDFVIYDVRKPDRRLLEAVKQAWISQNGDAPGGNAGGDDQVLWESPVAAMTAEEKTVLQSMTSSDADSAIRAACLRAEEAQVQLFEERGCTEQLLFDAKLKAKGLLDLDLNAPCGVQRPAGGVGAAFAVTARQPDGSELKFDCPADRTILDAAEDAGIELPCSCRSGACSACAGKLVDGVIDQSDQSYLDDDQIATGYVMTCCAYPRSDVVIETEKAGEVS